MGSSSASPCRSPSSGSAQPLYALSRHWPSIDSAPAEVRCSAPIRMKTLTRRDFLVGAGAAAGALAAGAGRAVAAPAKFDGTIRFLGIGYELLEPIRKRAERDLGLRIVHAAVSPPELLRTVRQRP